jgi:hypothetical protein
MAVTDHERFEAYAAKIDDTVLNHIRSMHPKFGLQQMVITPSGSLDVLAIAEAYSEGMVDVTTGDIAGILALAPPLVGYASTAGAPGALLLQFQQRADGGSYALGSAHATITSPKAFITIDGIDVAQDAKEGATCKYSIHLLTDGTNPAIVMAMLQALSGSVAVNGLFKLGSVTYEGSTVLGVEQVSFKTGLKYESKRSSGFTDPDVGSIVSRDATLTVSGTNLSLVSAVSPTMSAISSGLTLVLQNVYDPGDGNNISITIAGGVYSTDGVNAQGKGDVKGSIVARAAGTGVVSYSTSA